LLQQPGQRVQAAGPATTTTQPCVVDTNHGSVTSCFAAAYVIGRKQAGVISKAGDRLSRRSSAETTRLIEPAARQVLHVLAIWSAHARQTVPAERRLFKLW